MGSDVTIGLLTRPDTEQQVFRRILTTMALRGVIESVSRNTGYSSQMQSIPLDHFPHELDTLLADLQWSSDALSVRHSYATATGNVLMIEVDIYGRHPDPRIRPALPRSADIWVSCEEKELIPHMLSTPGPVPGVQPRADHEDLFLFICGLQGDPSGDPNLLHAVMGFDRYWPPPDIAAMLYHRDLMDFARDYLRLYAFYRLGDQMPYLLANSINLQAREILSSFQLPDLQRLADSPDIGPEERARYQFLIGLDQVRAERLAQTPQQQLYSCLLHACDQFNDVHADDYGNQGFVLIASLETSLHRVWRSLPLRSSLWHIYNSMAAQLLPAPTNG